jgi:hypothetical protein
MTKRGSLCALLRAKIFHLVVFQFQCSIIQAWENMQSTKRKTGFIPAEVERSNKSKLAML